MATTLPPSQPPLARQARERFVAHLQGALGPISDQIRGVLAERMSSAKSGREMQQRRDELVEFEREGPRWVDATARSWRRAIVPATATARARLELATLELIGDDVVENKILASRLALEISEKAVWEFGDLKLRVSHLEGNEEMATEDVLRPEALSQVLIEQWGVNRLSRELWISVKDVIHGQLVPRATEAYRLANEFLVSQNVLRDIDLTTRVKRGAGGTRPPGAPRAGGSPSSPAPLETGPEGGAGGGGGGAGSGSGGGSGAGGPGGRGGGAGGGGGGGSGGSASSRPSLLGPGSHSMQGAMGTGHAGVGDETRMLTASTPLARARARASGVLGQLRRLISERVGGDTQRGVVGGSPALQAAVVQHATQVQQRVDARVQEAVATAHQDIIIFDDDAVEEVAIDLRQRSQDLKKKASTSSEKATIEIVALMFQAILSEERIPAAVRVWFARLQMPVLRVALAEPEFFSSLEHPARQLIDRMGSCVLGFDSAAINGSTMEIEIKRVVQVIEQYPETGRRVFELVYDEFQKFLSKFLTENDTTMKLVTVAQQVEQKETMAIQYTIEMRKMLSDVPVRDEIRDFLFKVWAEVMAVSAVKHGPKHAETAALKKSAADLLWAASAKPSRNERARVIQELPGLLARLRKGMAMLGLQASAQEGHIKVISDTLADAFLAKTQAISQDRIEVMAKRLSNLEEFVSDEGTEELELDNESIEMMLGMDASLIDVISSGGTRPTAAMMSWANELQLGNWFTLDHNGKVTQVQYCWRSERKHLHLFAAAGGRTYLVQLRRLASYLQAGLLVPTEEETLTVRATRDALAKLEANPERLVQ